MNNLSLDLSDERFAALNECPDGEQATVSVSGVVHRAKDGTFSLDVESAELVSSDYDEPEEKEPKMAPAKGGPDHPAVMVLVAKKK